MAVRIETVGEHHLHELLPLMRGYCDFYEVTPTDEALLALSRALIADPEREGVQLLARDADGAAAGFATVYWLWSTSSASRIALMNDLFVDPAHRGGGYAEALIEECRARARAHGATELEWQTAHDNQRAQAVYDRVGGKRDARWLSYGIGV